MFWAYVGSNPQFMVEWVSYVEGLEPPTIGAFLDLVLGRKTLEF